MSKLNISVIKFTNQLNVLEDDVNQNVGALVTLQLKVKSLIFRVYSLT